MIEADFSQSEVTIPVVSGHETTGRTSVWLALMWSLLALVPIIAFYVAHFLQEGVPLGFIMVDLPYYCANGREIFEGGNGVMYANPYDWSSEAPTIYFQWLIWLYGALIIKLGFDPGVQFVAIGAITSWIFSYLSFRIVEASLSSRRFLGLLYLLTMWGGGFYIVFTIGINLKDSQSAFTDLQRYMPYHGWWFMNWGSNAFLPHEAVYHSLVAATWLALMRQRTWLAALTVSLVAATHPFTGLQHLAAVGLWFTLQFNQRRTLTTLVPVLAVGGVSAVFLSYYMLYLPSFTAHSSLESAWRVGIWDLCQRDLCLAYGPVAALAFCRLVTDPDWKTTTTPYFLLTALVTFCLIKHDVVLAHHKQPIHFTRGYLWMPLMLIGLPYVQREICRLYDESSKLYAIGMTLLLFVVAYADNAAWIACEWPQHAGNQYISTMDKSVPFVLTENQWDIVENFAESGSQQDQVLCSDRELSYLLPTYSAVKVYLGHRFNTPDYEARRANVEHWLETGEYGDWFEQVTVIVVEKSKTSIHFGQPWEMRYSNADYEIYVRRSVGNRP